MSLVVFKGAVSEDLGIARVVFATTFNNEALEVEAGRPSLPKSGRTHRAERFIHLIHLKDFFEIDLPGMRSQLTQLYAVSSDHYLEAGQYYFRNVLCTWFSEIGG